MKKLELSVVIPCHNESENIAPMYEAVLAEANKLNISVRLFFVDDGSSDDTNQLLLTIAKSDNRVRVISLSRNFGKEIATTAGIQSADGQATIIMDADGQHPPALINEFITKWQSGAKVVVGVRRSNSKEGIIKKFGSKSFYWIFNKLTGAALIPGSTDFRLIDKEVRVQFSKLTETNRITRGLIDWLGYKRDYVNFDAPPRIHGEAAYSTKKLIGLALNSFVSLSFAPLYFSGYLGLIITPLAFLIGLFVLIEQYILGDPMGLDFTGGASLGILIVFMVGILLISQGLMSLYISRIYEESKQRPLYVVDNSRSVL